MAIGLFAALLVADGDGAAFATAPRRRSPSPRVSESVPELPPAGSVPIASSGKEEGLRVGLDGGRALYLAVRARRGETWDGLAARFLGEDAPSDPIRKANPAADGITAGRWYRIPAVLLTPEWRATCLRAAFPGDAPSETGWVHRPGESPLDTYGEGAWEPAVWFTGDGRNFEVILRVNGLTDPLLAKDASVTVPAHLLLDPFRMSWEHWMSSSQHVREREAPPAPQGTAAQNDESTRHRKGAAGPSRGAPAPGEGTSGPGEGVEAPVLAFGEDADGPYALYRLKRGEAIYSAVVVHFTGRLDPEDVAEAASLIARRSGIRQMTDIPVGFAVKIPRALLLPEFLPADDSRRLEVEAEREEASKVKNAVRSRNLDGIHVILDAGHGGIDPGATIEGIAEREYVYDVLCRIKRLLETRTGAVVHPIVEDPDLGFSPRQGRILLAGSGGRILTTPAHLNGDPSETSLGVNLRWYLANAIERRLVKDGIDPQKIVFASLHADVLHPSLRGAMIYVPGERYRRGTFACRDADCARYLEVREAPIVRFTRSERLGSEGLSRQFAAELIAAFRRGEVQVHRELPVRDRIIRRGRDWLPAVLRGNAVPVKVLVEMVNLNNPTDRGFIQDPAFRQRFAAAFVEGVLSYYGAHDNPAPQKHLQGSRRPSSHSSRRAKPAH